MPRSRPLQSRRLARFVLQGGPLYLRVTNRHIHILILVFSRAMDATITKSSPALVNKSSPYSRVTTRHVSASLLTSIGSDRLPAVPNFEDNLSPSRASFAVIESCRHMFNVTRPLLLLPRLYWCSVGRVHTLGGHISECPRPYIYKTMHFLHGT